MLESLPERQEVTVSSWDIDAGGAILGSSFSHEDAGAGKRIVESSLQPVNARTQTHPEAGWKQHWGVSGQETSQSKTLCHPLSGLLP